MHSFDLNSQLPSTDILDNIIDLGIALFDNQGNYLFVNTNLINWRNISRAEFLKMNVHDFQSSMDICVFDLVMEKKQRVTRLQTYRSYYNPSETSRLRMVTGTPIFDEQGQVKYVITLMQDVEGFEKQYRELLQKQKVLSFETGSKIPPSEEKQDIVVKSPSFQSVLSVAQNVAALDSTVLICGESGTGKEVVARYIYEHSERKNQPFITVSCANFPENLIEAELFGYEKGSFTGANKDGKVGLVEAANGGTLFLDEINSLPLNVQGKLLRTLEDKSIQRIGSTQVRKIDFRLITATNRNLLEMVQNGSFREDLYYRIQVIPLTIPPVRNRKEDIVPLCLYFLHYFCKKYNIQKSFSDEVLAQVSEYSWPGNVRELRNFVERMVVMTPRAVYEISKIPEGFLDASTEQTKESAARVNLAATEKSVYAENHSFLESKAGCGSRGVTKEQVIQALALCGGHRERAAAYLGISRRHLQYKIKEFHISNRCRYSV